MNPILPGSRSIQTWPAIAFFQLQSPETNIAKWPFHQEKAFLNDAGKTGQIGKTP
jgi:hypothetical protein